MLVYCRNIEINVANVSVAKVLGPKETWRTILYFDLIYIETLLQDKFQEFVARIALL